MGVAMHLLSLKVIFTVKTSRSHDISTNAVVYMWNPITPVKVGNKCTVRCDDYPLSDGSPREWQMSTYPEKNSFELECKEVDNQMKWVPVDVEKELQCIQVCYDRTGRTYGDEVDPIWDCSNANFINSECVKSCPAGYSSDKTKPWQKKKSKCRKKSYGTSWSVTHFKPCIIDT